MSSQRPPSAKGAPKRVLQERRADPEGKAAPGSLRHLKSLLGRPIGLQKRDGQLHVVLVERRQRPALPLTLQQLCAELRARVLAHRLDNAAQVMRHLVYVHDKLGQHGWPAVEALPAALLAKAVAQAGLLVADEPVPALAPLFDRLRLAQVAAAARDERAGVSIESAEIEVSETTQEAFDEVERSWLGTVPAAFSRPDGS